MLRVQTSNANKFLKISAELRLKLCLRRGENSNSFSKTLSRLLARLWTFEMRRMSLSVKDLMSNKQLNKWRENWTICRVKYRDLRSRVIPNLTILKPLLLTSKINHLTCKSWLRLSKLRTSTWWMRWANWSMIKWLVRNCLIWLRKSRLHLLSLRLLFLLDLIQLSRGRTSVVVQDRAPDAVGRDKAHVSDSYMAKAFILNETIKFNNLRKIESNQ